MRDPLLTALLPELPPTWAYCWRPDNVDYLFRGPRRAQVFVEFDLDCDIDNRLVYVVTVPHVNRSNRASRTAWARRLFFHAGAIVEVFDEDDRIVLQQVVPKALRATPSK